MAVVMLVLVLLAGQLRISVADSFSNAEKLRAKESALLSAAIALGKLQKNAGPDQRATATASILGDDVDETNRFISGVWNTADPEEAPEWLVSGRNFDVISPHGGANATEILLGSGTLGSSGITDYQVRAPLVDFGNNSSGGQFAFWVSDEGVKASLGLTSPGTLTRIDQLTATEIGRLGIATPLRNGLETVFSDTSVFEDSTNKRRLERIGNIAEFSFFPGVRDPSHISPQGSFHDYTVNAKGLLTNPISGGIKKDLSSAPEILGQGFEAYMNYPAYLQAPDEDNELIRENSDLRRLHLMAEPNSFNPADGEILHSVAPIITDFGIQFSPHFRAGNAVISMQFALELWNPYTSGLVAEPLTVEIEGFRPLTLIVENSEGVFWEATFDLMDTFGTNNTVTLNLTREQLHSGLSPSIDASAVDAVTHPPGRVLYWIGADLRKSDKEAASFGTKSANRMRLELDAVPAATMPAEFSDGDVIYRMPETELTVTIRKTADKSVVLGQYEDFTFAEVDSGNVGSVAGWSSRWLTFQFRMIERGHTFSLPSQWLKFIDKRTVEPSFSDLPDPELYTHTTREGTTSSNPDDSALRNNLSVAQDGKQFYFERVLSGSQWSHDPRRDVALFELPRQPLVSIGQLQHLHIVGMPPYSIGNPWGGEAWNQLFDDYFLSGIQDGISMPDFDSAPIQIPHPRLSFAGNRLIALEDLDEGTFRNFGEDAGVLFSVEGQFNVNSVSPRAWTSILGGSSFQNFDHAERDQNFHDSANTTATDIVIDQNNYPVGFTRFPQSIQELFDVDAEAMDRDDDRHLLSMKTGLNFLTPRTGFEGDDSDYDREDEGLLLELGSAIAEAIRERNEFVGRPYTSLREFLTEDYKAGASLIETILSGDVDEVRYPRISSGELRVYYAPDDGQVLTEAAEERTPSWLSQADIISALAPFLSVRSDTFRIRAYGSVVSKGGQNQSPDAWCELIVERRIDPVDTTLSIGEYSGNIEGFGRKFEVVGFRWLDASEI